MTTLTAADRLTAAVSDAIVAMHQVDVEVEQITEPHQLAHLLAELAALRTNVGATYRTVERAYIDKGGDEKKREVGGVGLVEIKKATAYKAWQHDKLWARVSALALDERKLDPETGELLEREAETVARVLRDCATPAWKVTGLRAHGIQVDEYCQVEEQGYSVRLPTRSSW